MTTEFAADSSSLLLPVAPRRPVLLNDEGSFFVLDGGMGREIERRGGPFQQPEWSALSLMEQPDIVQDVHLSFLSAGAQAIITNTYAVVPFHIGQERYDRESKRLLQLAVQLAMNARNEYCGSQQQQQSNKPLVLGSIPPICGSYQPELFDPKQCGPIIDDFMCAYTARHPEQQQQQQKQQDGKEHGSAEVDGIVLETIGSSEEARFCLERVLNKFKYKKRIWLSFCLTVEYGYDQPPHLVSGEKLSAAVRSLSDLMSKVEVVCVNCCDMRLIAPALKELKQVLEEIQQQQQKDTATAAATIPYIGAYPNAFTIPPPDAANLTLRPVDYNITPDAFKNMAQEWIHDAGAKVIGGCCGVSPDHIRALSSLQKEMHTKMKGEGGGDGNNDDT